MISGLIGKKLGMTQIYDPDGNVIPVTVIKAGPCVVVQKKQDDQRKLAKVQIGMVEESKVKNVTKALQGHFKKANVPPTRKLKEFYSEKTDEVKVGDLFKVDIFSDKETVNVVGMTKGKGFQGVVKRWNFSGGKKSHGSRTYRRPGSIGMCAFPGKVHKGKKLPGRTGGKRKTIRGLKIAQIDLERNMLLVKGAVPGAKGSYVYITKGSFNRR